MTPPKKPEWMEMADWDKPDSNAAPIRAKKGFNPVVFVAAALLIGVSGVLFAFGDEETPASATEIIAAQSPQPTDQSATADSSNSTQTKSNSEGKSLNNSPTANKSNDANAPKIDRNTPVNPMKPSIATLPTTRGDDDHEGGFFGEREGHERGEHDGHERGEHDDD